MSEGVRSVFERSGEFELTAVYRFACLDCGRLVSDEPDLILIDCDGGITIPLLRDVVNTRRHSQVILWGAAFSLEFASHAIELGARAILPADQSAESFLEALRVVRSGRLWFTKELVEQVLSAARYQLTRREGELITLLSHGLKNKEIAHALGIGEGTVKVYLSRVFKKVGVNDRFQLALYALRNVLDSACGVDVRSTETLDAPSRKILALRE
jgi:DNA-binding NarL/FixJ family response regulator